MTKEVVEHERERDDALKLYPLLVEMADRVSQRRQAANNFYLSVNTGLIGASAYLTAVANSRILWVLGIAGIAISILWIRNIDSYRTLNAAKFQVIHDLESRLSIQPFADEWRHLDPEGGGHRHTPFHQVEVLVPWVFVAVHGVQSAFALPWPDILKIVRAVAG